MSHFRGMPKVLRIVNRFNLGGPSYNVAYLSGKINEGIGPDDLHFDTRVIGGSPAPGEAHSGYILQNLGVTYEEIPEMSRAVHPIRDLRAFFKILKIIRNFRPDIVHTHAAKAGALGRLAAWLCGVPVIIHTYHGHVFAGYFSPLKARLARITERLLCRISTRIVNISPELNQEITEKFQICSSEKSVVIPLGFDLSRFTRDQQKRRKEFRDTYKLDENMPAVGIIGRLAPVKNHTLFIEAASILRERGVQFRAFVIGDGEIREDIKQKAAAAGLHHTGAQDTLVFTSWIKEIELATAGLDLIVLTSFNEGTPVSLIEAQAAGRPVISTDVGGVRSCMIDGKTGFIAASDAQSFASAMEKLLTNSQLRASFGLSGQEFVLEKFSYTRLVQDVRRLYVEELGKNNKLK